MVKRCIHIAESIGPIPIPPTIFMEKVPETKSGVLPQRVVEKIRKVFPNFNPEDLKEADLKVWRSIKRGQFSPEEFEDYRRQILKEEGGYTASTPRSSRLMFVDFVADKLHSKTFNPKNE